MVKSTMKTVTFLNEKYILKLYITEAGDDSKSLGSLLILLSITPDFNHKLAKTHNAYASFAQCAQTCITIYVK